MKRFSNNITNRLTARHKKCFQFCGEVKNKDILDIGCSFGWFEKMVLQAKCKSIIGIEPSKELFYSARIEVPKARYLEGSALNLPLPDSSFNMVVMFDVIEHLPKQSETRALQEIYRVLMPKGEIVISTPYSYWLSKLMDPAWYFGHRHYKEIQLVKLLSKVGFEVSTIEKKGGVYELTSAILMYVFKWLFRREIPYKDWFEIKKEKEYLTDYKGYETIYIKAIKKVI